MRLKSTLLQLKPDFLVLPPPQMNSMSTQSEKLTVIQMCAMKLHCKKSFLNLDTWVDDAD